MELIVNRETPTNLHPIWYRHFGFQPQGFQFIQRLAKAEDIHEVLRADALGTPIRDLPLMTNIHSIKDIELLAEFTSLVDTFETWVQFFQRDDQIAVQS